MIFLIQFVGADELELGGFGGNEEGTHDLGLASSNPKKIVISHYLSRLGRT